jgi:diguanylate cyclase (GGDEF)-like protein
VLEVSNRALAEQSLRDPLTGLRNRRFAMEAMDRDVAKVHRDYQSGGGSPDPNRAMLFLMVDLDHFKAINDLHGHKAGDAVLVQTAGILTRAMRETDSVVRWGGEEFVGIARSLKPAEGTVLAEGIRAEVEAHAFALSPDQILRVTCSVGVAAFPLFPGQAAALSWAQCIDLADACLYAAKHGGRNRWVGLLPRPGGEYHGPLALHARDFAQAGLAT